MTDEGKPRDQFAMIDLIKLRAITAVFPNAACVVVDVLRYDGPGGAWQSVETIAEDTGLKRRTVQRALRRAAKAGLFSEEVRPGRTTVRRWLGGVAFDTGDPSVTGDAVDAKGCQPGHGGGVAPDTGGVSPATPEQIQEQILEQTKEQIRAGPSSESTGLSRGRKVKAGATAEERDVFDHWRSVMGHPRAVLDAKRIGKIRAGVASHGVATCKAAIDGCARSRWHMGENDNRKRYDGIATILRDAERIETFAEKPTAGAPATTGRNVNDPWNEPAKEAHA